MILNSDRRGRTAGGRTTYRPLIQLEPDDFPPDSKYWHGRARQVANELTDLVGYDAYCEFIDTSADESATWRQIYDIVAARLHELRQSNNSTTEGARA